MNSQADTTEMMFDMIKGPKHFLPDRFLNSDIAEKLWAKALPKHKPKDYAHAISKYAMLTNNKEAKRVDPGMVFIYTLGCEETRDVFYSRFVDAGGLCGDLILEQHLERWLGMLPEGWRKREVDVSDELKALLPSLYHGSIGFLFNLAEESFYKNLPFENKDIADLCINLLLIRISNDEFTIAFFDAYPWARERQSKLYQTAKTCAKEFEDRPEIEKAEARLERSVEVWRATFKSIEVFISERERVRTRDVLFTQELLKNFNNDPHYSPVRMIQTNYFRETEAIKNCAAEMLENSVDDDVLTALIDESDITEIIDAEPLHLPDFELSAENHKILTEFETNIRKDGVFCGADYQNFFESVSEKNDLSETISEVVQGGDLSELAKLGEYGQQLKTLIERIKVSGRSLMSGMVETYRLYKALPEQLIVFKPEAHMSIEEPTGPSAEEQAAAAQAQVEELSSLRTNLDKTKLALQISQERESEMITMNDHLLQEIDQLKRALHAARSIPVVEKGGEDFNTELSGEWLRGLLREDVRSTPEQILIAYATIAPDRLVVLPSALKSAREADNFELPARLSQLLDSLVYQYLDLIRKGVPDTQAKEVLGNRYAANESQTVTQNSRLRTLREFSYNGEVIFFRQHIGIGSGYGTQHAIRVHFKVIDEKIVIAYCGAHLETMRTN
jgi:hypothetical protein